MVVNPPGKDYSLLCSLCRLDTSICSRNKLLQCTKCHEWAHLPCVHQHLTTAVHTYPWECSRCKSCIVCHRSEQDDPQMLLCDSCDRGYHMYCIKPQIAKISDIPDEWFCPDCQWVIDNNLCPIEGCNGLGHVNGRSRSHNNPRYCTRLTMGERMRYAKSSVPNHASINDELSSTLGSPKRLSSPQPVGSPFGRRRKNSRQSISARRSANDSDDGDDRDNRGSRRRKRNKTLTIKDDDDDTSNDYIDIYYDDQEGPEAEDKSLEADEAEFSSRRRKSRQHQRGEQNATTMEKTHSVVINRKKDNYQQPPTLFLSQMKPNLLHEGIDMEAAAVEYFKGHLTPEQASLVNTLPGRKDLELFDKAKKDSKSISPPMAAATYEMGADGQITLPRIKKIVFGDYEIDTWYIAPYPEEYNLHPTLYVCEFCLKYMSSPFMMERHQEKCVYWYPPGDEIYRKDKISVFEVDGRKNKMYCQNLCLMAKMFLDHKTLYYDVEPFLFYILTENDSGGCHFVGYFSKEKRSSSDYNLSCIVTLPCYQSKGYGRFLIDFSYLLSRKEGKPGSPEKPLSDLGLRTYQSYWRTTVLLNIIRKNQVSIEEISNETGMTADDVVTTLQDCNFFERLPDKDNSLRIVLNKDRVKEMLEKLEARPFLRADPGCLQWTPFILTKRQ